MIMPLHKDDPTRDGNLSDEEYEAAHKARAEAHPDALHIIPTAELAAVYARLGYAEDGNG